MTENNNSYQAVKYPHAYDLNLSPPPTTGYIAGTGEPPFSLAEIKREADTLIAIHPRVAFACSVARTSALFEGDVRISPHLRQLLRQKYKNEINRRQILQRRKTIGKRRQDSIRRLLK